MTPFWKGIHPEYDKLVKKESSGFSKETYYTDNYLSAVELILFGTIADIS